MPCSTSVGNARDVRRAAETEVQLFGILHQPLHEYAVRHSCRGVRVGVVERMNTPREQAQPPRPRERDVAATIMKHTAESTGLVAVDRVP